MHIFLETLGIIAAVLLFVLLALGLIGALLLNSSDNPFR